MDDDIPQDTATEPTTPLRIAPNRRSGTGVRMLRGASRTMLAMVSVVVLAGTGYGWAAVRHLDQGIARTNVFDTTGSAPTSAGNTPPPLNQDVNILLVGMDSRTDPQGNPLPANELAMLHAGPNSGELNTDTMILVHIPAGGQQAVAISFPRDSYVRLAGGYGMHRLNSAFAYAHNDTANQLRAEGITDSAAIERQADTAGRKNLIATIEQLIGNALTINRYAEVNLVGFYQMAQAVGGVQVCLNAATHDDYTDASFPAGVQTISGVQALNFVRQRHGLPRGDLDRIVRQQVFLGALASKIISGGTLANPGQLSRLMNAVQGSLTLSSGWDVATFASQLQGLTTGAIQFHTIPTGPNIVNGEGDVTEIDVPQVQWFVRQLTGTGDDASHPPTIRPDTTTSTTPPNAVTTTPTGSSVSGVTSQTPITAGGMRCVN